MRIAKGRSRHFVTVFFVTIGIFFASTLAVGGASSEAGSTTISTSPVSASFLPSGEGWILTGYHCPSGVCIAVKRTMNDGTSWTSLRILSGLRTVGNPTSSSYFPLVQQNIYFANAKDGWIYGSVRHGGVAVTNDTYEAEIWSTHNGGATWSAVPTKSLGMKFGVLTVSSSRRFVYAISWLGNTFGLWRSSITSDSWQRVRTPTLYSAAGGSNTEGALIFKGANGWLMLGNDRGATAGARLTSSGRWVTWRAPCDNVGGSFSAPVANSSTTLVDVCTIGGFGGDVARGTPPYLKQQTNWVYTSNDAGLTFEPTSQVVLNGSSLYLDSLLPGLPASPSPGKIVVAKSVSRGMKTSDHLYLTQNGGQTWRSVYATPLMSFFPVIQFVSFASTKLGYAIVETSATTSELIISTNGGRTWHATQN